MLFEEWVQAMGSTIGAIENSFLRGITWLPKHVITIRDMAYVDVEYLNMEEWCKQNCKGRYHIVYVCWFFENDNDALGFKLVWG
jgi:hypothetical protein